MVATGVTAYLRVVSRRSGRTWVYTTVFRQHKVAFCGMVDIGVLMCYVLCQSFVSQKLAKLWFCNSSVV